MVGIDLIDRVTVCIAAVVDEVRTDGQGIAGEERNHLVGRQAGSEVSAMEQELTGFAALVVSVVDSMVTEVVVQVDVSGSLFVFVLQRETGHAADDVGPAVEHGSGDSSGILGVGLHETDTGTGLPRTAELISELDHTVGGMEGGALAVTVGTVVSHCDGCGETAFPVIVGKAGAVGSEGASHRLEIQAVAVLDRLTGNDIDGTSHGIGSVEYRGSTARNLDALCIGRHVFVSYGMTVNGLELRVTVDEDDDTAGAGSEAAKRDGAGSSVGNAVSSNATRGHEEAGNLLHHRGHYRSLIAGSDRCAADHGNGSGKGVTEDGHAGTGDDGSSESVGSFLIVIASHKVGG